MKIVITPAKRMNDNIDYIDVESLPVFCHKRRNC